MHVLAQVHTLVSLVLQTDHSLHCLSLEAFFLLYLEIKEILINYYNYQVIWYLQISVFSILLLTDQLTDGACVHNNVEKGY